MNYFSLFLKKTLRYLLKPLSFVPALFVLYFIFHMSSQDGAASADMSYKVSKAIVLGYNKVLNRGFSNEILQGLITAVHPLIRKTAHFTEFFALAVTLTIPLYVYRIRGVFLFFAGELFCAMTALLDEYSQSFSAGRSPSLRDVLIDSTGAFFGILFAFIICHIGKNTIFHFLSLEEYRKKKEAFLKENSDTDLQENSSYFDDL